MLKLTPRSKPRAPWQLSGLFAAALVAPVLTMMPAPVMAAAAQTGEFAAAIANLASQIRSEIARLPKTSRVEEYEAAILFLADQSGQPVNVVCAAFDEVRPEATTPDNAKVAMSNVCRIMRTRRGTGALGGSGNAFGSPGFASPVISVGGGSSTYSTQ